MKKYVLLFLSLITTTLLFAQNQNEQIQNSSFETWTQTTPVEPLPWKCNIAFQFMGQTIYIPTGSKTTDAYDGSFAVKLQTTTNQNMVIVGMIQLSRLKVGSNYQYQFVGGYPFGSRPTGISFWYKYQPQQNDTAFFGVILTKYLPQQQKRDTIAASFFFVNKPVNTYTQFFFPIIYKSLENPDSIDIGFISSSIFNPKVGSVLYVDKVELVYDIAPFPTLALPAINVKHNYFDARWLASPYSNKYRLDVATNSDFTNYVPGFENLLIQTNTPDSIVIYRVNLPENYANQTLYYRVRVDYSSQQSINSNVISVFIPPATVYNNKTPETPRIVVTDKKLLIYNTMDYSEILLYSLNGQLIHSGKINTEGYCVEIPHHGIYLIKLNAQDKSYVTKVFLH